MKIEEAPKAPNVIIDTGEDTLSISPHLMDESEKTDAFLFVGNHLVCWGLVVFQNLEKYKIVRCNHCYLRIKVPVDITTAEELKEFLEKDE